MKIYRSEAPSKCQHLVLPLEKDGIKQLPNKCKLSAFYIVDKKPMCKRHAEMEALNELLKGVISETN